MKIGEADGGVGDDLQADHQVVSIVLTMVSSTCFSISKCHFNARFRDDPPGCQLYHPQLAASDLKPASGGR